MAGHAPSGSILGSFAALGGSGGRQSSSLAQILHRNVCDIAFLDRTLILKLDSELDATEEGLRSKTLHISH